MSRNHVQVTSSDGLNLESACEMSPNWNGISGEICVGLALDELDFVAMGPRTVPSSGHIRLALDTHGRLLERQVGGLAARANACNVPSPFNSLP